MYHTFAIQFLVYSLLFVTGIQASPLSIRGEVDAKLNPRDDTVLQNACCYTAPSLPFTPVFLEWTTWSIQIENNKDMDASCGAGILDNVRGRGCAPTSWSCHYVGEKSAQINFNTQVFCTGDDVKNAIHAASQSLDYWIDCISNDSWTKACPSY